MTLGEAQREFMHDVGRLIIWAYENGYELTGADLYRSRDAAVANAAAGSGIANSLHCDRLAIDLNLFIGGVYQSTSEAHRPLGDYWKSLRPGVNFWGGDFQKPDGNHYSRGWQGRK